MQSSFPGLSPERSYITATAREWRWADFMPWRSTVVDCSFGSRVAALKKRWKNTPSSPYSSIQRKCVSTVDSSSEQKKRAPSPFVSLSPVGYVFSYSETSGHMSMRTEFSSLNMTPPSRLWNQPWYPAMTRPSYVGYTGLPAWRVPQNADEANNAAKAAAQIYDVFML